MNDDLEHTLRDSLDRHAAGGPPSAGSVDDVYQRADRRHARRRSVAVIGSIAAVTIGIVGFAALGSGSDPSLDQAAAPGDQAVVSTWADTNVYGCTSYLGSKDLGVYGQREMYGDCVVVTWMDNNVEAIPECIVPTTVPMTTFAPPTAPPTIATVPITGTAVANATAEAVACGTPVPSYQPECFPTATTTMPATTTTIAVAIGTVPDPAYATTPAVACATYSPDTGPAVELTAPATAPINTVNCMTSATTSSTLAPVETSPNEQQHVVAAGDSIYTIAAMYRIDHWALVNYNAWTDCTNHMLFVGDVVLIPPGAAIP